MSVSLVTLNNNQAERNCDSLLPRWNPVVTDGDCQWKQLIPRTPTITHVAILRAKLYFNERYSLWEKLEKNTTLLLNQSEPLSPSFCKP